jgi:hypothetical protein
MQRGSVSSCNGSRITTRADPRVRSRQNKGKSASKSLSLTPVRAKKTLVDKYINNPSPLATPKFNVELKLPAPKQIHEQAFFLHRKNRSETQTQH